MLSLPHPSQNRCWPVVKVAGGGRADDGLDASAEGVVSVFGDSLIFVGIGDPDQPVLVIVFVLIAEDVARHIAALIIAHGQVGIINLGILVQVVGAVAVRIGKTHSIIGKYVLAVAQVVVRLYNFQGKKHSEHLIG